MSEITIIDGRALSVRIFDIQGRDCILLSVKSYCLISTPTNSTISCDTHINESTREIENLHIFSGMWSSVDEQAYKNVLNFTRQIMLENFIHPDTIESLDEIFWEEHRRKHGL